MPIAASAPEELTTISFLMRIPPAPFVAPEQVGQLALIVMFVYAGDPADGQAAIAPFREVAKPILEVAMPMPYPGIYQFTAAAEAPGYGVIRSRFLDTIDDDAIDAMLDAMAAAPSPMAMVQLRVLGGAVSRVPADATAFAHRAAPVMVAILDHYMDPSTEAEQVAWTEGLHEQLAARSVGVYSNFLAVEGDERIHEAYPGPPTRGWRTSSAATTRRTCSRSTRTSARPSHRADRHRPRTSERPAGREAGGAF